MDSTKAMDDSLADGKELDAKADQVSCFCNIIFALHLRLQLQNSLNTRLCPTRARYL